MDKRIKIFSVLYARDACAVIFLSRLAHKLAFRSTLTRETRDDVQAML